MVVEKVNFVRTGIPHLEVITDVGHTVHVSFERGTENARSVEPASVEMVSRNAALFPPMQRQILEHLVENHGKKFTLPPGFLASLRLAHEKSVRALQRRVA